jgi:gliding motility-associated protein GldL
MGLAEITQGKKWKNFMAKLYGIGAAIVIVGALFKIQHWPGAGPMLILGLGTEAVIFFFSAFEPPHEEVDWSLVYPELAGMHDDEEGGHGSKRVTGGNGTITQELDKMLEEAKIGPELLESLGSGMRSLGDNAAKLVNISDASVATNDYADTLKTATQSVNAFSNSSAVAAEAMSGFAAANDEVKIYNDQIQNASKNLAALNAIYELQLQDSNVHLKAASKFHEGMNEMVNNLNASVEQTAKYREEITSLSKNLSALNTVYGNMLSAMSVNRGV